MKSVEEAVQVVQKEEEVEVTAKRQFH